MADKKFQEAALKAHNDYRDKHQAPKMKLNRDISATAQKWAEQLARTNTFAHSNRSDRSYKGETMGENIAMKWTSSNDDFTGDAATDQWYSEIEKYNFERSSGPGTGHFTQVVWKGSLELGIGKAQTRDGKWLVVANYFPAGNFIGRYPENVLPPKDGKIVMPSTGNAGGAGPAKSSLLTQKPTQSSHAESKTISTRTESGPGYTKTIVTETTIMPDGSKKVTTKESVVRGESAGATPDLFAKGFSKEPEKESLTDRLKKGLHIGQSSESAKDDDKKKKKPQKIKDFIDDTVKAHNKARKKHGAGDLKHNKELSVLAQRWADHLATTNVLKHSNDTYQGDQLGENVATKWTSTGEDYTGQEVVDQWYSEIQKFNWSNNTFQSGTGHFTQVVWKGSKEVGVGKSTGSDGRVFVVANYRPAGNVMGRFPDNISPAK